ncbi:uncharacterized protein LOC128389199 [Panonychus citri]|uniref:uncharacterized protein LOC128389199 n=1 Tax=Panonychus citri TaxID=50023 RepID=UPI002307BB0E|nr:uncharacterized protein LOC128389199 [Panonychus citri]
MPRMRRQSPRTLAENQRNQRNQGNQPRLQQISPAERSALKFDRDIDELIYKECDSCNTRTLSTLNTIPCSTCKSEVRRRLFSTDNNMDPGQVPDQLKVLSPIEELLIAKIHPVVTYYRIRGEQTGYSGNVINFRQNINRLYSSLPPSRDELSRIIVGVREGNDIPAELSINAGAVRAALLWLKQNHQYYSDIEINENALADLEREPNLDDLLDHSAEAAQGEDCLRESYFPLIESVNQDISIQATLSGNINWPEQDPNPINEFRTEGYISQAFPKLFPYGKADLNAPRQHKVDANNYFKFLMVYRDGRFAKHPRFRFFAMNSVLRWQALSRSSILICQNDFRNSSVEEVSRRLLEDPSLRSSIMAFSGQLRSTTPYWKLRAGELLDMVNQLGSPTIFFTLSAADYHWNKLFELICPDRPIETITDAERRTLMHENPMITAQFFKTRIDIYRKTVLKTFLNVKDFWMRYEWQFRGSPHVHGLLWLENAPDLATIDSQSAADKQIALEYCSNLTKAMNPNIDVAATSHPCRKTYSEIDNIDEDLSILLNTVQRHTRHGSHCLRKKRGSNQQECRFKFPQPLSEADRFENADGVLKFVPKRNDESMNRYNDFIIQTWRANIDFNIVTSVDLVLNYIAKYVTKGEVSSMDFNALVDKISHDLRADSHGTSLIRKIVQASLSGRDYSAQEVVHVLMGWPLYESSRTYVKLNLSDRVLVRLGGNEENEEVENRANSKLIAFYQRRPIDQDVCLTDYAKQFEVVKGELRRRKKVPIIRVFPRFKKSLEPSKHESFCKQQVQLYIPWWRSPETLKDTDVRGGPYQTWAEAYTCLLPDGMADIEFGPMDDEYEEVEVYDDAERNIEMAIARFRQNLPVPRPMGDRLIDHQFKWDAQRNFDYSEDTINEFLYNLKRQNIQQPVQLEFNQSPTEDQNTVLELCSSQISNIMNGHENPIKRCIVQGKAGTGKSFLIKKMVTEIRSRLHPDSDKVLAPTGVAATNISGSTYHSFLKIQRKFKNLENAPLRNLQLQMEHVKFLIFDEVSMIGLKSFLYIDTRCKEATGVNEAFGGLCVYFLGDLQQPPVLDPLVYNSRIIYRKRYGDEQIAFRNLLDELALGRISDANYDLLMTRRINLLSVEDRESFKDSMYLFSTNELVKERNAAYLHSTGFPVAEIKAEHNCATAANGSDCQASCLEPVLNISINSRVMLRRNLWVDGGLVNGSLGTVTDIIYEQGRRPKSLPRVVMVKFDRYLGSNFDDEAFPIIPVEARWTDNGIECSRKQLPLNLAFAITIHKAQGLTLDKAVIDIGSREHSIGLSYVGLSRVRKITDLAIQQYFAKDRIDRIAQSQMLKDRLAYMSSVNLL